MSESSYYECCDNYGTHTVWCVRKEETERNIRQIERLIEDEWQREREQLFDKWNVIEGEHV